MVFDFVEILYRLLITLLLIKVLLSWLAPHSRGPLVEFVNHLVDPVLDPIRRSLPRLGPFDFSPLVLIFIIRLFRDLIYMWL